MPVHAAVLLRAYAIADTMRLQDADDCALRARACVTAASPQIDMYVCKVYESMRMW